MSLEQVKHVRTGSIYPTPLELMPNLTRHLNAQSLYIKRDDLTGLAFGGNKTRKLDYIVADALNRGFDTLLTYGGVQTNHGRITAAAAAKFGMKSILMCYGRKSDYASGNLILDRMLGAEIVYMDTSDIRNSALPKEEMIAAYQALKKRATDFIVSKYEAAGHKVMIIPIGGHSELGTLGYVQAIPELMRQMEMQNVRARHLVVGYGSTGTFAGLWLGAKYYRAPLEVIGAAVSPNPNDLNATADFINKVSQLYGLGVRCSVDELQLDTSCVGSGYNEPDAQTRKMMYLLAQQEAIFLDPCYTGKSFGSFVNLANSGAIGKDAPAIYWHTGGTPAIWTREHLDAMQAELWGEEGIYQTC